MVLKDFVVDRLRKTPLFIPAREIYTIFSSKLRAIRRTEDADLKRIRSQIGTVLQEPLYSDRRKTRTVLVMGMGRVRFIAQEAVVRKSLELAGYRCAVLIPQDRMVVNAYRHLGSDDLVFFDNYQPAAVDVGTELLANCRTLDDLTALTVKGIRCGKYAVSTLMRKTRSGTFDLSDTRTRQELVDALNKSARCVETARRLIDDLAPDALVLVDRGYSPSGELFDTCIEHGIPVFTWNAAHRNDTLMLKRYTAVNKNVHPSSLSTKTWQEILQITWTSQHWDKVRHELESCYSSGEWYAEVGTQFNKKSFTKTALMEILGVDPTKKTAVIFPHIFWDATFFWGEDLFENYEDWFIQTVKAACLNDRLNWVIKVHPANLVKNRRDGVSSEHSELGAIRKAVGKLPPHVRLLPADTDISTLSLFSAMDCCVTVRGTVGIEAACFGVPVLTAGTGRYDRLGFTLDSDTRDAYLTRLATAENLERLDEKQTELARRHAYGVLLVRPAQLEMIKMRYQSNETADLDVEFQVGSVSALRNQPDINTIATWMSGDDEDYLHASIVGKSSA
jgi:hypothetical protein